MSEIKFEDIFAGPPPEFEETKRLKGFTSSSSPKDKKDKELHASTEPDRGASSTDSAPDEIDGDGGDTEAADRGITKVFQGLDNSPYLNIRNPYSRPNRFECASVGRSNTCVN